MNSTVLIVDDNPKNLQVLTVLLYQNNFNVEVAHSGFDALKWIEKTDFDAILLDIMMPEMNGFETCRKIKSNSKYENIPIIFLTARNDIESIEEGFKEGGIDYITKPFNQSELLVRLKTHIDLKKSKEKLIDVNQWLNAEVEKKTAELKKAYEQVKQVNEQLCKLDDAKSYFLNSISHELRTPLNGIIGSVGLLKTFEHNDNVNEILELLDASIKNLEKYSYSALQISHLQLNGDSQLSLKRINLVPIIHATFKQFLPDAQKKNIDLKFKTNSSDISITADYNLVQKAIISLIDCAFTYTYEGFIEIETIATEDEVQIIICDSGTAYEGDIIDHFLKSIYIQNFQFKRNNSIELYLVQIIVSLHRGNIKLLNQDNGKGTKTIISLPASNDKTLNIGDVSYLNQ